MTLFWVGITAISAFCIGRAYEVFLETKRLLREKERLETEIDSMPTRKGPDT